MLCFRSISYNPVLTTLPIGLFSSLSNNLQELYVANTRGPLPSHSSATEELARANARTRVSKERSRSRLRGLEEPGRQCSSASDFIHISVKAWHMATSVASEALNTMSECEASEWETFVQSSFCLDR